MGGQGYDLGQAYGKIVLDASGLQDGINKARQSLASGFANMGNTIQSFGDQMTGLGARITALSAPFSAFAASGVQTASSFDVLMKQIELFGGVTGSELEAVRQTALQLGRDTQFSSQDVGTALLDLLKSGQSLEQALATLPEVLDLAAAGEMSLAQAAGITSSGLAQFRMEAAQSERLTNALAQAANASRADVNELGQALANVGPVASQYGLDVEETSAILGVFHNNAIMGAEAGTQLKSMLLNLTRPTDDVQSAYDALGVSLYDSSGNVRDFNTFLLELDEALDALPVEQQNEMMQRLGGSYGIVGLSALRASNGIGDMLNSMRDAPEAGQLAEGFMDTFAGKVESLKGSFETLKIEAFTPFMNDVLKPFVERMIEVVNGITEWVSANPELTKTLIQIGGAIAIAGSVLMGLGFAISNIGVAVRTVTPLLGLLTSPLGLIAGGGLALAHVFDIDLRQAFEDAIATIQPILEGLYAWFVEEGMPAITDFIQNTALPIIGQIGGAIAQVWADVSPTLSRLYNWFVTDAIPAIADIIQTVFIPIVQDIGRRIGEIWAVVAPVLAQIYEWFITTAIPAIANMIETVFIPAVQGIAHIFSEIYQKVAPILQFLIEWFVTQAVPIIAGLINDVIIPAVRTFMDVLSAIWNAVAPALQSLVDWFQASGWPFIENIINTIITPAINLFVELLKGIWNLVEPVINLLVNWFEAIIVPAIQLAVDAVTIVIDTFIAIFTGIWGSVEPALNSLRDWFNLTIVPIIQGAIDLIRPIITELERIIGAIWTNIEPFVKGLRDGLSAIFTWIRDRIIQPVIDLILSIPRAVEEARRALDIFNGNAEIVQKTRERASQVGATYDQVYANAHSQVSDAFGGGFFGDLAARFIAPGVTSQVVPNRDSGGIGLADMPYLIGKPQENNEIFVPRTDGTFIPNFMDKMDALFERGDTPSIGTVVIHANTEEGGRAAARGFVDEFERTLRSKG